KFFMVFDGCYFKVELQPTHIDFLRNMTVSPGAPLTICGALKVILAFIHSLLGALFVYSGM
ncbi:hypothetical protein CRM22_005723, partial [Opisthorchis felineus]